MKLAFVLLASIGVASTALAADTGPYAYVSAGLASCWIGCGGLP